MNPPEPVIKVQGKHGNTERPGGSWVESLALPRTGGTLSHHLSPAGLQFWEVYKAAFTVPPRPPITGHPSLHSLSPSSTFPVPTQDQTDSAAGGTGRNLTWSLPWRGHSLLRQTEAAMGSAQCCGSQEETSHKPVVKDFLVRMGLNDPGRRISPSTQSM